MRDAAFQGLAVGFFDGVHLGHQAILRGADRVLTFENHPLSVLAPARAPRLMMSLDERLAAIRACGVKEVEALPFTADLAKCAPEVFAARYLKAGPNGALPRIRCGENWHFGAEGSGDAGWLRENGYEVEVVPYAVWEGDIVSSSRIRAALATGDLTAANAMLGRSYRVTGVCVSGKGVGRTIGFPTVNFRPRLGELGLPHGVYVVDVSGERAIANYGTAPTMGARAWSQPVLEVHFPGRTSVPSFEAVSFLRFIRPERTFASIEELTHQISADLRAET